jgi:hypothetical protein
MTRLMRNQRDGKGKYSVFNNRKKAWVYDDGPGDPHEHFVVMLADKAARAALLSYAAEYKDDNPEYSKDVMELANRSGPMHPNCKAAD